MSLRLGVRENLPQFALLVLVNGLVGGMVGFERTLLPAIAEQDFHLTEPTLMLGFIAVFGSAKALTNLVGGHLGDRFGRKPVLVAGWVLAIPVPVALMVAPSWGWILAANALLGVSQGLTWSTTVVMKIDLAGPRQRGLAMGLNESAGYIAVSATALATGLLAARYGLRPVPFAMGVLIALLGAGLSWLAVKETHAHTALEAAPPATGRLGTAEVFRRTTLTDPALSSATAVGFVNNLNDGVAWGLFPVVFAQAGLGIAEIGWLVATYPAVWGLGQLITGAAADRYGRRPLIVGGMALQAAALIGIAAGSSTAGFALASVLLGVGTAMAYPALLAVIADASEPDWRGAAVGVYRLWRDSGYVAGAVLGGLVASALGVHAAVVVVAALTLTAALLAGARMPEREGSGLLGGQTTPPPHVDG